ncbi:tail fiber protein [Cronobacter dublinensis]
MNRTDAPKKQPVPFAVNGQREALLPTTPAGDNTASYNNGFPPVTMILKAAGGLPPKGQDMNQILFELSSLSRWFSSGALNSYDAAFSSSISGYPKGSVILSDDGLKIYISTSDGNTANPNSGGSGWKNLTDYLGLGLDSGSLLPVGVPVPYSLSTPPAGWLKCNGATFSASQYPKLALAYPSLSVPDLRGEFIRGWDDGKGVDSGRVLMSSQGDAMRNIQGRIDGIYRNNASGTPTGAFTMSTQSTGVISAGTAPTTERITMFFDVASAGNIPLASEIRPRNIAFNYIVRAA